LHDANIYGIDDPYNEEHIAPLVVRHETPPSTISEESIVHREKQ
jgi:hypothetical protein